MLSIFLTVIVAGLVVSRAATYVICQPGWCTYAPRSFMTEADVETMIGEILRERNEAMKAIVNVDPLERGR